MDDPLADEELLGLELVYGHERQGKSLRNLFAIERICSDNVGRTFEPGPDGAEATAERVVEFAVANGWTVVDRNPDSSDFAVDLSKPSRNDTRVTAWVLVSDRSDRGPVVYVSIH
ncbi:MAG: hypothetical protein LBG60_05200 [Bifidobacteriaceae bacterium]|nr:hypothetical protein [Bifidobacteriaceae bacterium]